MVLNLGYALKSFGELYQPVPDPIPGHSLVDLRCDLRVLNPPGRF